MGSTRSSSNLSRDRLGNQAVAAAVAMPDHAHYVVATAQVGEVDLLHHLFYRVRPQTAQYSIDDSPKLHVSSEVAEVASPPRKTLRVSEQHGYRYRRVLPWKVSLVVLKPYQHPLELALV